MYCENAWIKTAIKTKTFLLREPTPKPTKTKEFQSPFRIEDIPNVYYTKGITTLLCCQTNVSRLFQFCIREHLSASIYGLCLNEMHVMFIMVFSVFVLHGKIAKRTRNFGHEMMIEWIKNQPIFSLNTNNTNKNGLCSFVPSAFTRKTNKQITRSQ